MQINLPPLPILTPAAPEPGSRPWRVDQILAAKVEQVDSSGKALIRIGRQTVQIHTQTALKPGQNLQLQVVGDSKQPVFQLLQKSAGPAQELNRISQALRQALPRQLPLSKVIANLHRIDLDAGLKARLPTEVLQPIKKVVQQAPDAGKIRSADGLKQSLRQSGLFFERDLRESAKTAEAKPSSTTPTVELDLKGLLLRLLAALHKASAKPISDKVATQTSSEESSKLKTVANQPEAKTAGQTRLDTRALARMTLQQFQTELVRQVEGALARIQLHQVASVPKEEQPQTIWQFELPVKQGEQFNTLQVRVESESSGNSDAGEKRWFVTLSFDFSELGPVHAQIAVIGETVSTVFWAEQPDAVAQFNQQLENLRNQFESVGLAVGNLHCRTGKPPTKSPTDTPPILSERA